MFQGITIGVLDPFQRLMGLLPAVALALVLLLAGLVLARVLRALVEKVLAYVKLDEYTDKVGLNEILLRLGLGRSPAFIIGFLVYWLIVLMALVAAANAVQLTVVSELLERFVLFIPQLLGAILVMAGGFILGHFLGEIVLNAAKANDLPGAGTLSKMTRMTVVVFAAVIALEKLGLDTAIIRSSFQIILGTVGLAAAIAFGLGGRDAAADLLRDWRSRFHK
ncbi:MAG: hypothetical protein HY548_02900 [Elusimicrobia bacterium]|nr:hypothetical protein [Elusimicrobiota bacterium]